MMPWNGTSTADLLHIGACHYPLFCLGRVISRGPCFIFYGDVV